MCVLSSCGRVGFTVSSDSSTPVGGADAILARYPSAVLADSPFAYWRLGESTGTIAVDSAGRNDGTYNNGPTLSVSGALAGDPNTAVDFGGSNDFMTVVDFPLLRLNGAWTLEFWAKLDAPAFPSTFPALLAKGDSGTGATGWLIYVNSLNTSFAPSFKRAAIEVGTSIELSTTTFQHFVLTYDGVTAVWYVNGTEDRRSVVSWPPCVEATPFSLGNDLTYPNESNLSFDELAMYDHALSPGQIQTHYQAGI